MTATSPGADDERRQDERFRFRAGVRAAITWLHARARGMNDPHATAILNSAAYDLGGELSLGYFRAAGSAPEPGSPYLNLPTRRASDAALQIAIAALREIERDATEVVRSTPIRFFVQKALRDIEALVGPGITTGEGQ